mmetsp:Transcript_15027/g.32751  ORF Transcript_15027/g.32751 Transcript_15027/m.32751 type:complete len:1119 (-) Transcript_15027:240-3596(-)
MRYKPTLLQIRAGENERMMMKKESTRAMRPRQDPRRQLPIVTVISQQEKTTSRSIVTMMMVMGMIATYRTIGVEAFALSPHKTKPSPLNEWKDADSTYSASVRSSQRRTISMVTMPSALSRLSIRSVSTCLNLLPSQTLPNSPFNHRLSYHNKDTCLFQSSSPSDQTSASKTPSAEGNDDSSEWKAALAAFKMYKAAYGNLKIPQRFVVPNMKPWPKAAWGMRLGKVVQQIRATGKFVDQPSKEEERRAVLDDLGFLWQVRVPNTDDAAPASLEQLYTALATYVQVNAPSAVDENAVVNVPTSFVVPRTSPWPESVKELPLGKQLAAVLPKALLQPENADWKDKFEELGYPVPVKGSSSNEKNGKESPAPANSSGTTTFSEDYDSSGSDAQDDESSKAGSFSANDLRFQKVYQALQAYRNIYGDLLVPQPFVVPPDDSAWPQDTWGLRLGARVNAIRSQGTFVNKHPQRKKMLDDLGFAWNPPRTEMRRGRQRMADAENAIGDSGSDSGDEDELSSLFDKTFDVQEFDMDSEKEAKPSWGFEGGGDLQDLALQQAQLERSKEEDYTPPRTLAESLDEARQRALDVGIISSVTENNRVVKGKRDKNIPWFNDDFGDDFVFEDVVEALTLYRSFYGDFSNLTQNYDFIVPTPIEQTGFLDPFDSGVDDDDEDQLLGGFDADASARAARAIAEFEQQGQFDKSEDLIAAEIKRLQQQVGANEEEEEAILADTLAAAATLNAEKSSALAAEGTASNKVWPEHLAGMMLGSIVARIRDGSLEVRHLEERKVQLDALEFDWGEDKYFIDIPFEKAMCAMYAYYLVRGDMFVYEDFVMPNEDPWPEALAGYEVGKAVKRIRELQNFMEAYHPEKVSLLRMIDFVWFPTSALPLDPNEPEMDAELLALTSVGHPDIAKLPELPMGFPEKIMANGPYFESDDPKQWWRRWHNWDDVKDLWYEMGRRDNAYVLRLSGYPKMAEEHEAKYGPGLFTQIENTMSPLREEGALKRLSVDEKKELLSTINYYKEELAGCTDLDHEELDEMILEFDETMLQIMNDEDLEMSMENEEDDDQDDEGEGGEEDEEYEYEYEYEYEEYEVETEVEVEEEDAEEEDFDVEGELGLSVR